MRQRIRRRGSRARTNPRRQPETSRRTMRLDRAPTAVTRRAWAALLSRTLLRRFARHAACRLPRPSLAGFVGWRASLEHARHPASRLRASTRVHARCLQAQPRQRRVVAWQSVALGVGARAPSRCGQVTQCAVLRNGCAIVRSQARGRRGPLLRARSPQNPHCAKWPQLASWKSARLRAGGCSSLRLRSRRALVA